METALDRFARTRGAALVGTSAMGRQWRIQTTVGGILTGTGSLLGILPLFPHVPSEVAYAALGPFLAGMTNLGLGLYMRAVSKGGKSVLLSEEASSLLQALVLRAQVWQGGRRFGGARRQGSNPWHGYKAPTPPSTATMDALERAAAQHGRVFDALGESKDERAVRLRAAADAGMGEILHHAATGHSDATEETVARMVELADLVTLGVERPSSTSALRSNLESTLEELRSEEEARRELSG